MKDGFNREKFRKSGTYYCASCCNFTMHNKEGACENTDAFRNEVTQ